MAITETATATAAPAKRKRAAFTRTAKPVYAIVSLAEGLTLSDANGAAVKFSADSVRIKIERDSALILDAVLGGSTEFVGAAVKQVDLPAGPARAKPAA